MTTTSTSTSTADTAPAVEEWRDIPGYEGHYMASSLGRIRSHKINPHGRIMSLSPVNQSSAKPSYTFTPFVNGVKSGMTVARAVCLAFHGQPPEPGMQVRHNSQDYTDNRPENLRWAY